MKKWLLPLLCAFPLAASSQEMVGQLGSRTALLTLHTVQQPDGGWRVTGEYMVLPTLQRRFLEGERSPQLGVTTLKEGTTPILFGHDPTGELRGTWRAGTFKGTRYGPGGQERERFEFSEEFPSMEGYSGTVRCEAADEGRYSSSLSYSVESGSIKAFEWRSRVRPGGHSCELSGLQQQPLKGGLRLASGECSVTLRALGEAVKIAAEGCSAQCDSQAYPEPMLVERRGSCRLLRPEAR
ncbi:MAG TPA: hypothetical protein VFZ81_12590 [Burkholderiales bacterium]